MAFAQLLWVSEMQVVTDTILGLLIFAKKYNTD